MKKFSNTIKITSSALLALCMVFLMSACANSNSQPEQSQTTEQTTVQPTTMSEEEINDQKLDKFISNMTLEEKVGQMFYVRCPDEDAVKQVSKYNIGGYILFGRDFDGKTKDEVINDIQSYQDEADIPLLIGVDEEGGTVVRVSSNPNLRETPFLSPKDTYSNGGWDAIEQDANGKADLLLSLGINVNMAPVCDMTSNEYGFMYDRSFSSDVDMEDRYVRTVVETSKAKKLGTVLKHFPGYGNNSDTHTGIAYDDREYSEFENTDFKPFYQGIESGADCILVSHNIVNCMDSEYPASLSQKVHNILRNDFKFDGVIMTDDLIMDAITEFTGDEAAAVTAAKCGNDLLCCSSVDTQYPAVLEAVQNGEIPETQVDASVKRILKWKQNLGIFNIDTYQKKVRTTEPTDVVVSEE
ncbi:MULTISPECIES: glycoside hydrolase family 3 N-terminal domain-containing protein [Ruminococcus]|jgi:beta-N-acetylhexosaminidase|uniref:glycoside hydrolase family 3 protein n=1 Tax=Ruminococcus sp. TaxID=41978 RepID=UPI0015A42A7E|nr:MULTISPECIES: glycoside hydrolase family 3 N-terminal domain-containing protein [Ruminococcus]